MKKSDSISAVLFLLFLGVMLLLAALGAPVYIRELREGWLSREDADGSALAKLEYVIDSSESAYSNALDRSHLFVQLYGGVQRLIGRRMVADAGYTVTRLNDGALTFCGAETYRLDVAPTVEAVAALAEALGDVPLLTAIAPEKIPPGVSMLPSGIAEYGNEMGDDFLALASEAGLDTLDLRVGFDRNAPWGELFFRTDHHWRPEGAFTAYCDLAAELDRRYGIKTDPALTDEDSYERRVYENIFLGSQGKRVGSLYAGKDDFTVYVPRFSTSFEYSSPYFETRRGSFNEALCFEECVAGGDMFNTNPYCYYSGGDFGITSMVNKNNPDGPRIVMLRESFGCALAPFLALSCGELITIDLRHYEGSLLEEIESLAPDLVLIMYCTTSFKSMEMFEFGT